MKLYKALPQELKDVLESPDTGDTIYEIAKNNGVDVEKDEALKTISELVTQTLLGLIMPSDLAEELKSSLGIKMDIAEKISRAINRFIFYPVKPALENLYKIETDEQKSKKAKKKEFAEGRSESVPVEEQKGSDAYREPIE